MRPGGGGLMDCQNFRHPELSSHSEGSVGEMWESGGEVRRGGGKCRGVRKVWKSVGGGKERCGKVCWGVEGGEKR